MARRYTPEQHERMAENSASITDAELVAAVSALAQNITMNNKLALDVAKAAAEMEVGETIGRTANMLLGSGER